MLEDIRRSLAVDSFWALVSRVAPKLASTLLFVLLVRRAGESAAGTFSLSIAFLSSVVLFSSFGLDELVIRDIAKDGALSKTYLWHMLLLRGLFSVVGYGVVAVVVSVILGDEMSVRRIVLFQCLALFPEGLNSTLAAVLTAKHALHWMAVAALVSSVAQTVLGGIAISLGAGLGALVVIMLAGSLAQLAVNGALAGRLVRAVPERAGRPTRRPLDGVFLKRQLVRAAPFAVVIVVASVDLQLDVILLSALRPVSDVGIYSAARSIVMSISLLPRTFRMALYPSMANASAVSEAALRQLYRQCWHYLALTGLPIAVGGALVAPQLVQLFYGSASPDVAWAFGVLMIYLLANFMYIPGTRLMVVVDRQVTLSLLLFASTITHLVLGIVLVPPWGVLGIAATRALSSMLYLGAVEGFVTRRVLPRHGGICAALWAAVATIPMGGLLWALQSRPLYMVVPAGALCYGLAWLLLGLFGRRLVR